MRKFHVYLPLDWSTFLYYLVTFLTQNVLEFVAPFANLKRPIDCFSESSYHQYAISRLQLWLTDLLNEWLQTTMLLHLSTLPLVVFLGAIVCTAAYDDDDGLPALTDQASDHQEIIYDVDNGVNPSFVCTVSYSMLEVLKSKSPLIQQPAIVNNLWNTGGIRSHLNRAPYEGNCQGGHVVSSYLSSLNDTAPKIRNVVINSFNSNTGLLTVSSYEYRMTSAPWPTNPNRVCPGIDDVMSTNIEYT